MLWTHVLLLCQGKAPCLSSPLWEGMSVLTGLSIPSSVAHPKAWQWPQQRGQKLGVGTWEVQTHPAGASLALG